ncbi:MAG: hypothetical protein JW718_02615 [Desulfovibrionaceae bacterium]|nr:hypothetical protein [Desulfovibrionaceae bacterium]
MIKSAQKVLAAACIALCLLAWACGPEPGDEPLALPRALAGRPLAKVLRGAEALAEVERLHGRAIDLLQAAVGFYPAPGGPPAMVWISRSRSPGLAAEQGRAMIRAMSVAGATPFRGPTDLDLDGVRAALFTGLGQEHLVFGRGALLYWVCAPPGLGLTAARETLAAARGG